MDRATDERPKETSKTGLDLSWRRLYLAAGISALGASASYLVALILTFSTPELPTSGGARILEYIAEHRSAFIAEQILWLAPSILLAIVFLAFYPALKHIDKSWAAIGAVLGVSSWIVTLAYPATGGGAPALAHLSDQYVAADTEAQRAAFAAAAEGFYALNYVPTHMGVLEAIGILIVSVIMLKSDFHRSIAWFGVATGAIGIFSEALKPLLGLSYAVYGLLLIVWIIAIGWEFIRLARLRETGYIPLTEEPTREGAVVAESTLSTP